MPYLTDRFLDLEFNPMRKVSFTGDRTVRLSAPVKIAVATRQATRRRLDDHVAEIFHRACTIKDLEAAADLLALLEKWHFRRATRYGRERRIGDAMMQRARKEAGRLRVPVSPF
jgi:hypothetical protein